MSDDHMPCGLPERRLDPRDDRTGYERSAPAARCTCGRHVIVRGKCAYCLHAEPTEDRKEFAEDYARDAKREAGQ